MAGHLNHSQIQITNMAIQPFLPKSIHFGTIYINFSSPKGSVTLATMRTKFLKSLCSGISHSYSTAMDQNLASITGFVAKSEIYDDRNAESTATLATQIVRSLNNKRHCGFNWRNIWKFCQSQRNKTKINKMETQNSGLFS